MRRCAVGATDGMKVVVGLESSVLFAAVMERLTDEVRQEEQADYDVCR